MPTTSNTAFISNTNTAIFLSNTQVQVQITNANNVVLTPGIEQNLYVSDVITLKKVLDFGLTPAGLQREITQANLSSAIDITRSYVLNNGQKDNLYDHASISLKPTMPKPRGKIVAYFDYYSHSGTSGYLTVDSYPNATTNDGYNSIPIYLSPTTGGKFRLADCVDWRPIRPNGTESTSLSGARILQPDESFVSDYSYYLGRTDKIVLTSDRVFKVIEGVPSQYPETPKHNEDDMLLYTLKIPPYTMSHNNVSVTYTENKRYTMRDIGKLEKRIENLEYYTSLNMLELSADSLSIKDSNGLDRFKNGIIVDSFNGHKIGDVLSPDYSCSMNFEKGELRPYFIVQNTVLGLDPSGHLNINKNKSYVTLDYTEETFLEQGLATDAVNINPYNYSNFVGTLIITPDSDVWVDTTYRPQVTVNLEGENDAWEALSISPFGTKYGDWQTNWTGVTPEIKKTTTQQQIGYITTETTVAKTVNTIQKKETRAVSSFVVTPDTITKQIGDNVVDVSILPYIRPKTITMRGYDLKPGAVVYPFFDEKRMIGYWRNPTILILENSNGLFDINRGEILKISGSSVARVALGNGDATKHNILLVYAGHSTLNIGDTISGTSSGNTATINDILVFSDIVANSHSNTYMLNLAKSASNVSNSIYSNTIVNICSGTGEGQVRVVTGYDRVNRRLTVSSPFYPVPDNTSVYSIGTAQVLNTGFIAGSMVIPQGTFFVGQKKVRLTTDYTNSVDKVSSYADAIYYAQGLLSTREKTSVSTRVPKITIKTSTEERITSDSVIADVAVSQVQIRDETPPAVQPTTTIINNTEYIDRTTTIYNTTYIDRTTPTTDSSVDVLNKIRVVNDIDKTAYIVDSVPTSQYDYGTNSSDLTTIPGDNSIPDAEPKTNELDTTVTREYEGRDILSCLSLAQEGFGFNFSDAFTSCLGTISDTPNISTDSTTTTADVSGSDISPSGGDASGSSDPGAD